MEDWALRGMQRWPNVPALFGWLGLDRRGHWLIQGEAISRPQIIDTINRNYETDAHGRWFFQNGPQRGYVTLECAPFVLHVADDRLVTHTQLPVERPSQAYLDEEGSLVIQTEHGPAVLADTDLDWALSHLSTGGAPLDEGALTRALRRSSGQPTDLALALDRSILPVIRIDRAEIAAHLGFVRDPQPLDGETAATRIAD